MQRLSLVLLVAAVSSCVIGQRKVEIPTTNKAVVIVGSAALGHPLDGIARHPFVALREANAADWERWEVMCCPDSSPYSTVKRSSIVPTSDYGGGGGDVRYHALFTGKRAEKAIECIRREGPRYPHRNEYFVYPGPNSNTFVDYMIRACNLDTDLPATSIGKDFRGYLIGASLSSGGTGVQVETPLGGLKLGLTEGIEVHVLGLGIGVDLWPPALILPVGPGRLGFEDR